MDTPEYFLSLIEFCDWRRKEISKLVLSLDPSLLTKEVPGSFHSIYEILNHFVWAEKLWFARVTTGSGTVVQDESRDMGKLLNDWEAATNAWLSWVKGCDQAEFEVNIKYKNTLGEPFENTFGEIIVHFVDHNTYHIGQLINTIRGFGIAPVSTNYIHYLRSKNLTKA